MEVVLRVTSGPHLGISRACRGQGSILVGRSLHVSCPMPEDKLLSREHFVIEINPPLCDLIDLESTNGCKVNSLRVEKVRLRNGDVITAGESTFSVSVSATTDEEKQSLSCPGCGASAPEGMPQGEVFGPWLCPACDERRQSFPRTHPDYLIERLIGNGGMGEVYLAHQISTNRPVAVKLMVSTGGASQKAKEYFRREMTVLKDLLMPNGQCHSNVVAFYDIFEIEEQFQLVMEYVPGKNALEWITGMAHPLPIASAARVGRFLLSALEYAHGKGYVHRDVKPSNIIIHGPSLRPKVKLSDFGLAKSFRENAGFAGLTRQGDVGGSVGFISPDHIRQFESVKEPADIYSARATLYYLLTLKYPFFNFDPYKAEAYSQILENPPVPLRAHRPDAPEGLERVIARALAKQPRDRYKSARAMADALRPFADESGE